MRARAAVAQSVLDELEKALGICQFGDAHGAIVTAMEDGVRPEDLLDGATHCRNWNDFGSWVSWLQMQGEKAND